MRTVMFIASVYGLECYKAVKKIANIEITGILTTSESFVLRYGEDQTKEMKNSIYGKVFEECEKNDIPVFAMKKMNNKNTIDKIRSWNPELIIVSGWYHIIKEDVLLIPEKGVIALHASLLPRYRGGAPLVWQMIYGEKKAGITLFYMDQGTDTGDIIGQKEIQLSESDTIGTLYEKAGDCGIQLLKEYLPLIEKNCAPRRPQENVGKYPVYPQRKESDGKIDWSLSAEEIYNFIRAQTKPYPGAFSFYHGKKFIIWKCVIVKVESKDYVSGTICSIENEKGRACPVIYTGEKNNGIKVTVYESMDKIEFMKLERLE